MRYFAIINTHEDVDFSKNIISKLSSEDKIFVFQTRASDFMCLSNVERVLVPSDVSESNSKIKNFVTKYFFDKGFNGHLHVIEDAVEIYSDTKTFLDEIETMMSKLKLGLWFNTVTDPCNYTFKMYNPRFSVELDEPSVKQVYDKTIYWTSHANTSWICYDYSKVTFDEISFDESFTIPMYYIIKFLSERRNHKAEHELKYMNFYPTVMDELNVFRLVTVKETQKSTEADFKREGDLFNSMNINHSSDMKIEQVMDDMVFILNTK